MVPMLILLAICTLAVLLYMLFYVRTEIFRLNERQNTTLMHIARMNRSMTTTILQALNPLEDDADNGVDGEVEDERSDDSRVLSPVVEEVDDSGKEKES